MPTIDMIRKKLHPVFAQEPVYRVILFGSYAKGSATDHSDVDLIIDSQGKLIGLGFYRVLEEVVTALNMDVDMLEISQIRPGSPILEAIEKEGIIIYDREVA